MQLSYIDIAIKLALGLLSLVIVINISGKGNLAPTSASDQVQNYVLGGILGGVIYSPSISILQYFNILLIWIILVLGLKWLKTNNSYLKKMLDGEPTTIIKKGKIDVEATRKAGLTDGTLESMDKTEEWLKETLLELGYEDTSKIFLAEYDKGQLHIIKY